MAQAERGSVDSDPSIIATDHLGSQVSMARIDDAVSRILTKKFELGLFEHPYTQVRAALQKDNCRLIDAQSGQAEPITASAWASQVSPASGDLNILPPGVTGGGIEVQWKDASLYVSAKGGDVELS